MISTKEIKKRSKDFINFSNPQSNWKLDHNNSLLFKSMVEYYDLSRPNNNSKYISLKNKNKFDKDTLELLTNLYLTLCNNRNQRTYVLDNLKKSKKPEDISNLKSLSPNFEDEAFIILSLSNDNGKYSYDYTLTVRRKVSKILSILGFCNLEKGNFFENKITNLTLAPISEIKQSFIDYIKYNSNNNAFKDVLSTIVSMRNSYLFHNILKHFDWDDLETNDLKGYHECQSKVYERTAKKESIPLSRVYIKSRHKKKTNKEDKDYIYLDEESKEIESINNKFNTKLRKDLFGYKQSYNAYTDVEVCRELDGKSISVEGGRISSPFNYSIKKEDRKWLMKQMDLFEVDLSSAVINTMYIYETGYFFRGRAYNIIAESILKSKGKRLNTKEGNLDNAIITLSNRIKDIVIATYNEGGRSKTTKLIRGMLLDEGLRTNYIKDSSLSHIETQRIKTSLRNSLFIGTNGDTIENRNLLTVLGNCEITSRDIIKSLEKELPEIKHFMFSSNALKTQSIESETLLATYKELSSKYDLEPYLVHDCLYVPKKLVKKATKLFNDNLRLETIKYKANNISTLLSYDVETFTKIISKIESNNKNTHQSNITFRQRQSKYRYVLTSVTGDNSKFRKNLDNFTIWDKSDLDDINNLTESKKASLKTKLISYSNKITNFELHKFICSMYIYASITGEVLLKPTEINVLRLVDKDSSYKNTESKSKLNSSKSIKNTIKVTLSKLKNILKINNNKEIYINNNIKVTYLSLPVICSTSIETESRGDPEYEQYFNENRA